MMVKKWILQVDESYGEVMNGWDGKGGECKGYKWVYGSVGSEGGSIVVFES